MIGAISSPFRLKSKKPFWLHFGTLWSEAMPSLTIKNMPEGVYEQLKRKALDNRRSLNSEVLICLEQVLEDQPLDPQAVLAHIRELRQKTASHPLTDEMLQRAKLDGRP
jgi:antitoxin FitA